MVLVIGVGGMIGKNIFRFFGECYEEIYGTTHKKNLTRDDSVFHFDLLDPDCNFLVEK